MDHAETTLDLNQVSVSWNNTSAHSCVRSKVGFLAEQASPRDYEPNEQLDDMTSKQFCVAAGRLWNEACRIIFFYLFSDRICRNHDSGECLIESNTQRSVAATKNRNATSFQERDGAQGKTTSEFQAAAHLPTSLILTFLDVV